MRLGKDLCSCIYIIVRNVQIQTLEPKPQIQPYAATLPNWQKKMVEHLEQYPHLAPDVAKAGYHITKDQPYYSV